MKSFFKDVLKRLAVTVVSAFLFAIFSIALFAWITSSVVEQSEEKARQAFEEVPQCLFRLAERESVRSRELFWS